MNRDTNCGYLPDYSHPNHTLRTPRMSRYKYVKPVNRKRDIAWSVFGVCIAVLALVLANFL